jgi:uncharacterized Rmd1/YagE family protein
MKCSFYCTAEAFKVDELVKFLCQQGYEPRVFDQAIHVQNINDKNNEKNIFYFTYGCVVFWGFTEAEENLFLEELSEFQINPIANRIMDVSRYLYTEEEKSFINEEEDEIILGSSDVLIKLSLSYGLSQSVKLTAFENSVDNTIEKTRIFPEELKIRGETSLSKKQLSQMVGALFAERNSINLHSDILDTPEFFWKRPRYETYYSMAAAYLDIETRLDILNKRLEVIQELYQILSSELNHKHSARLELTIVILIVIEVIIVVLKDILKWL